MTFIIIIIIFIFAFIFASIFILCGYVCVFFILLVFWVYLLFLCLLSAVSFPCGVCSNLGSPARRGARRICTSACSSIECASARYWTSCSWADDSLTRIP